MTDWMTRAACIQDPDLFFDENTIEKAKKICESCSVRAECLDLALSFESRGYSAGVTGIWGGITELELPAERKRRRAKRYRERQRINRKDVA